MPDKVYRFSRAGMTMILKAVATWRVEGVEHVPREGPLIVVSNHLSNADPQLLACSLPRRLYFLAKRGLFKPGVGQFLSAYGAFPVDREGRDLDGFHWCQRLLERNGVLGMFPEATRHPKGGMAPAVPGVALLALRTGAPFLPVGITGTEHIGPLWQVFFPTGRLTVRIGEPFSLPPVRGRIQRPQLESLTTMVMQRVAALLPPEYRGVYQLPGREGSFADPSSPAGSGGERPLGDALEVQEGKPSGEQGRR